MKDFWKKHITVWKMLIIFLILILIIAIFNFMGILGPNILAVLNMFVGVFMLFWLGFNKGQKRESKGYVGGLQVGIITIVILFIISFLFLRIKINLIQFIYYGILLISSTLGGMMGINKKKLD